MRRVTSFLLLALSGILLFFAVTGPHGLLHLRAVDREIEQMAEKNRELDREILSLQNQIYGVQRSDQVLEEHAREQLGLSKPGEIVYILPPRTPSTGAAPAGSMASEGSVTAGTGGASEAGATR